MMHGLPKYLYPKGMFHLEATGPSKISGTLILPPGDKTYLVHCDIAQHMEKGMKAQLKVGKGDGDLPSIPGVTAYSIADDYKVGLPELVQAAENAKDEEPIAPIIAPAIPPVQPEESFMSGITVIGLAIGLLLAPFFARKMKGMSISEVIAYSFELLRAVIDLVVKLLSSLLKLVYTNKNKTLPEK
jgi:hypothetical protein